MIKPNVAVFVTGQLRNASENIENWLRLGFFNCNPTFFFCVWDEVGLVDPNKIYQRSLRMKKEGGVNYVEVSSCDLYMKLDLTLENEIKKIKDKIPNALIEVVPYKKEYLYEIGALKVNDDLISDTHPFWQGSIPVAYLNKICMDVFKDHLSDFDIFCRIQGETTFLSEACWTDILNEPSTIVSSSNSINKNYQISIKFFASGADAFLLLMNAYDDLIPAYNNYKKGESWENQPIGERFLKRLADKNGYAIDYSVKTFIKRQRVYPVNPTWKKMLTVKKEWSLPEIVDVNDTVIDKFKKIESNN